MRTRKTVNLAMQSSAHAQAATAAVPGGLQWGGMGSSSDEGEEPEVPFRGRLEEPSGDVPCC